MKHHLSESLLFVILFIIIQACASIGRPEGGPYDDAPPRFIKSNPEPYAINNQRSKINIDFDEYIKMENVNEKVIISPPQVQQPEIRAQGKKVVINLLDTLKDNTTYTIDFGDAIEDNNEGNALDNFTFTFSTGEQIDTLAVSGTVLDASNLEPIKGILVGLHSNLSDTAFINLPLERVGRTNSRGQFSIRGVAPGDYQIFALMDADQNFAFTQKSEAIAFLNDSTISPWIEERIRQDTTWIDSLTVDTIVEQKYTHFLPDDILLKAFKEDFYSQYLIKNERLTPEKFTLYFNAYSDTLPILEGLNFDQQDAFIIENSIKNDTIHYWIKDTLLAQQDTLAFELTYLYTDTLDQLVPTTDTLRLVSRQKKVEPKEEKRKKKKKEEEEKTLFYNITTHCSNPMDVYDNISFTVQEPLISYSIDSIHIKQRVDSIWHNVDFYFEQDSLQLRRFNLYCEWEPGGEYQLVVDSTNFRSLYGLHSDKIEQTFKVRNLDEYGHIYFNITGLNGSSAYVELLNPQDEVVRTVPVENNKADFYFLQPGKYAARLIEDKNGNGKWDTGNYNEKIQPENVYYYPDFIEFMANWEATQDWDIHLTPIEKQKQEELKKQKPDEDKKKKARERQRERDSRR
ncbi:MAG: hypothetical protein GX905_01315 [Bacteroidales bacterium]|nr:hypothetical protein [Bacteroidales bacterium]